MMMKKLIVKNSTLNEVLLSKGFVVVDFLNPDVIKAAFDKISNQNTDINLSANNNKNIDVSFHCTYLDHNKTYKKIVWQVLNDLIQPFLKDTFVNYKIIQANLFNKAPGTGLIAPHQNLTTVDEELYTSVSIWVPIQDTNIQNGTLCFLPKSHGKFEYYRNSNIHWAPMDASSNIKDYKMIPVNLKVGEALIFDDSIVHGSPDNNSINNRYVFHYLAIPEETNPIYCKKFNNEIQLVKVDDMFWQNFTPGDEEPSGPVIKTKPFKSRTYTKETLLDEMDC
jgi:hypothetical protein